MFCFVFLFFVYIRVFLFLQYIVFFSFSYSNTLWRHCFFHLSTALIYAIIIKNKNYNCYGVGS